MIIMEHILSSEALSVSPSPPAPTPPLTPGLPAPRRPSPVEDAAPEVIVGFHVAPVCLCPLLSPMPFPAKQKTLPRSDHPQPFHRV